MTTGRQPMEKKRAEILFQPFCVKRPTDEVKTTTQNVPSVPTVCTPSNTAYPTEQAIRQKESLKERKKALEDSGLTKEEIKKATKRKPQPQEKHYDDCGSDTGPIEEEANRALLAHVHGSLDDAVAFSFFDDAACSSLPDDTEELLREHNFSLKYLLSAEVDEDNPAFMNKPRDANFVECDNLLAFLAIDELQGKLDVMEIFGGASGVTKVSIRRKLKTGKVFDLITGFELTEREDQAILLEYIQVHKPMVIVAGPPCTAFASLSKINKWKYPESYDKSRRTGLILASLMAEICRIQMGGNRYFLIENPAGSELFQLPEFEQLWKSNRVGKITFPQCGLGLVTPEGEPIHKLTELWANAKELLMPFEGIRCEFDRHGEMVGSYKGQQRSKLAQVWPPEFCKRVVEGICLLLKRIGASTKPTFFHFPVEDEIPKRGRPRLYPEGAVFDGNHGRIPSTHETKNLHSCANTMAEFLSTLVPGV